MSVNGRQNDLLKQLPGVGEVIAAEEAKPLLANHPRSIVVEAIRLAVESVRNTILSGNQVSKAISNNHLLAEAEQLIISELLPQMQRVINATGIVIHTGLGRSLLSEPAIEKMSYAARNHVGLEVDIDSGSRGQRDFRLNKILSRLTGAESATVVNNNAAAVLISLNSLAEGREVIVSRGELVEIGGSFRIPDVMQKSGAALVEVGTTNKTKVSDYNLAINEETALLLKVHRSNFDIVGFTEEASLSDLVELGKRTGVPVMEDLGSGALVPLTPFGISAEQMVQERVAAGADIVTFSGDKLLGGPQAGLIVGKEESVARIKKNPLYRAVRCDKITLAGLEATLIAYFEDGRSKQEIPTINAISQSPDKIRSKARRLINRLKKSNLSGFQLIEGKSQVGGGALPTEQLATWLVSVPSNGLSLDESATRLRTGDPSVFCRINQDRLCFDLRTVKENEISELSEAIISVLS